MTSRDEQELEWQFDALDLGLVLRWLDQTAAQADALVALGPGRAARHVDVYFDTDDRRFQRAGYSVRVRRLPRNRAEATLKSLGGNGARPAGLRSRRELTERLVGTDSIMSAPGPVGERVRALTGTRRLHPLFEVHTRRRTFPLLAADAAAGEIAIDETAIRPNGGRALARLRRVEVEAPEAALGFVEPLVARLRSACGLQPATLSKFEVGLVATGPQPVVPEEAFGPTAIDPAGTIGAVALAVLRRQFTAMLAKEPGTRLGDDIEELHDMRVASRRLRAALSLFADFLPVEAGRLRDDLAWVGRTIGAVRDLDVQLAQLDEWAATLPDLDREPLLQLRALLLEQREDERATMLEALDSRRYDTFVRRFGRMLMVGRGARTPPARAIAPDLLARRHRALRKAAAKIGPASPPGDYHRARIAGKRFRYALEFLADVYPGRTQRLTRRTVELQDILGGIQDADVAIERLRSLAGERAGTLGSDAIFAMGEVAERYRRNMGKLQGEVPGAYEHLEGKEWKRLRRVMRDGMPVAQPRPARRVTAPPAPGSAPTEPEPPSS